MGTVAAYTCPPEYEQVGGSSLRACVPDGIWNGTEPSCGKSQCTHSGCMLALNFYIINSVCNISLVRRPLNSDVSIHGSTATYTCDTGYLLVGSQSRTCRVDWTSSEPYCSMS